MNTPFDPQIKDFISDPKNAQQLSEKIIENGKDGSPIIIEYEGEEIELVQIGSTTKDNNVVECR